MKDCPGCSVTLLDDAMSCYNCGYVFFQSESSQSNEPIEGRQTINRNYRKPNFNKLIGMIAAVVVVFAVIGTGVYFLLNSGDEPEKSNESVYENQSAVVVATQTEPETSTKAPERTTEIPTTAAQDVVSDEKIYITFFNFYISYLDGINSLNPGMIDFCTPQVKSEMADRFQYNKKSLFDLSRIDYDVDSFSTESNVISNDYSFYVKCVSRMYNRETLDEKDINYAVWKVTVTETDGDCVVSKMERDDKYKMGSNIETLDDNSSIF